MRKRLAAVIVLCGVAAGAAAFARPNRLVSRVARYEYVAGVGQLSVYNVANGSLVGRFGLPGVARVFFGGDFVTVTKTDELAWASLKPRVLGVIMDHFVAGRAVIGCPSAAPISRAAWAASHCACSSRAAWSRGPWNSFPPRVARTGSRRSHTSESTA